MTGTEARTDVRALERRAGRMTGTEARTDVRAL